ncbi:MAG: valine--tRNA ligase [bacterium]|nr:valine--tRNA ligase [bacterium]
MEKIDLPKTYDPSQVEEKWYKVWEEKGYFHADENAKKPSFSMVIPPPNITGSLHMGHALNNTLQDILVRWKRMSGFNTLWLPGTDHAGIATQNVVEKELQKEGLSRSDIGRTEFIKRMWEWKDRYGGSIITQLKRLGASCDWKRLRFTMDESCTQAVKEVFVRLYEEGYIYRGSYIINWCPRCHTALSDIEVEHKSVNGYLYYIKYPLKYPSRNVQYLSVATTRPETMLGDTAVAANPKDKRFRDMIGTLLILPILKRELRLIADDFVSPEFGTGLVKVTPAHDPVDFEIGKRHNLPEINILHPDARMNQNAGPYEGLDRYECRKRLLEDLKREGYLEKVEDYSYSIGHCYRCHTIVEPYLSLQWFVHMKELAHQAIEAVAKGHVRFVPKSWENTYFEWMRNIKDWCISRQIWWGHRIPVWYCKDCDKENVSRSTPDSCKRCGSPNLEQDPDVLDTWFSSALWPFSTLGWPRKTQDLETFYPTSCLSTGFDIIFFWVARMIIMGLKFMGDVPFRTVYIHALIRDESGQKMSKSSGNIIDPIHVIERYGADALRFTLAVSSAQGRDVVLSYDRIEGYRHFCNKIWNAARFILMNLEGYDHRLQLTTYSLELCDRWILSRIDQVTEEVTGRLETYNFDEAAKILYNFLWHEYCDWYIELSKLGLNEGRRNVTQYLLITTFSKILRLLHPFMPFITEELWQYLQRTEETGQRTDSIVISEWPKSKSRMIDHQAIKDMEVIMDVVYNIRNIRSEMKIPPKKKVRVFINTDIPLINTLLNDHSEYINLLGNVSNLVVGKVKKPPFSAVACIKDMEIYIPLKELIDIKKERTRLNKELYKISEDLKKVEKKLENKEFVLKASKDIVKKQVERREELVNLRDKLLKNLKALDE